MAARFKGSFIASFPGVNVAWFLLGLILFVAFLGVLASVGVREFLPSRRKPVLLGSLARRHPGEHRRLRQRSRATTSSGCTNSCRTRR